MVRTGKDVANEGMDKLKILGGLSEFLSPLQQPHLEVNTIQELLKGKV